MTVLSNYQRLEAQGLWRAHGAAQRRDVIVSIGEATLVIADGADRALTHWSLPAVERLNRGERPALYAPGAATDEELEIADAQMIDAIERVRAALARRRPQPGRLRQGMLAGALIAVAAAAVVWLPQTLVRHTASVLPPAKRTQIGTALLGEIAQVAGAPCELAAGRAALGRLERRLLGPGGRIAVLPASPRRAAHLPGGIVLLDRALVEDYEGPAPAAGHVLAENARARARDPVVEMLQAAGFLASLRLLTTGSVTRRTLDRYAEHLLRADPAPIARAALLSRFAEAGVPATPYAYARDISGESVLGLIEADPVPGDAAGAIVSDGDWVRLQSICTG